MSFEFFFLFCKGKKSEKTEAVGTPERSPLVSKNSTNKMKKDEAEASVVVAEEGSDDDDDEEGGGGAPPQLTARKPAAVAAAAAAMKQRLQPPSLPRPPSSSSASSASSQIPASLRVSPERLEALANSGPLAPTPATLSAVAADARLVSLLDDADVMQSVARISRSPDPEVFQRELQLLSRKGKAGDLVELYRRMAAVAAKRCEAFCGGEGESEGGQGATSSPLSAGLREREDPRQKQQEHQQQQRQQQQEQHPRRAGIEVLR